LNNFFTQYLDEDIPEESLAITSIKEPETSDLVQQDFEGRIRSLTNEISNLNRRNIELETECKRLQKRVNNWMTQMNSSDNTIRELQSRESDLIVSEIFIQVFYQKFVVFYSFLRFCSIVEKLLIFILCSFI
jgi:predicted nuclease with TOPRIM domain